MAAIVPRWEWRTFGERFGIADARFEAFTPSATQESDEIYFLGGARESAKVRDGLLDIKVLREVDGAGLERWEPVMKKPFPLVRADIAEAFALLHLAAPKLGRDVYTHDQFIAEIVVPTGALRPVQIHKRRTRYTVGGCMSEVTDVSADGKRVRTLAIESEKAAAVVAAVESVGLAGYLNTSYPRGLEKLLNGTPARYAVIDVGTNSVKLHVGEPAANGDSRAIVDRAEITQLGEGLEARGEIAPEAVERTAAAISGMVDEAKRNGVVAIAAVGTAGLRMARNRSAVVDAIRARTGVSVDVIPGEEEGRLAYLAAVAGLGVQTGKLVVFDTGGGSSQFTFGNGVQVEEQFSVNVGAARYTERFGLDGKVAPEVLRDALAAIAGDLSRIDGRSKPDVLVGMGGALTNIAAVKHALAKYDPNVVQGTVVDRVEIERQIELYRSRSAAERASIVGLQPKRANVILAGACIVKTVMEKLRCDSLRVSDRGLRHGVLIDRFGAGSERRRSARPATTPG